MVKKCPLVQQWKRIQPCLSIDNDIADTWMEGLFVDQAGKNFTPVQPKVCKKRTDIETDWAVVWKFIYLIDFIVISKNTIWRHQIFLYQIVYVKARHSFLYISHNAPVRYSAHIHGVALCSIYSGLTAAARLSSQPSDLDLYPTFYTWACVCEIWC